MARMPAWVAVLALLAACRGERVDVLAPAADAGALPIDSCRRALDEGVTGDACVPFDTTGDPECADESSCCIERAFCESGTLLRFSDCERCSTCGDDRDCAEGVWCVSGRCVPCVPPEEPPDCTPPQEPYVRNGCPTAECQPPSQCEVDVDCGAPGVARCVVGRRCACIFDECCVNRCVDDTCAAPEAPPEGCSRPEPSCPETSGIMVDCVCVGAEWLCQSVCASASELTGLSC